MIRVFLEPKYYLPYVVHFHYFSKSPLLYLANKRLLLGRSKARLGCKKSLLYLACMKVHQKADTFITFTKF